MVEKMKSNGGNSQKVDGVLRFWRAREIKDGYFVDAPLLAARVSEA